MTKEQEQQVIEMYKKNLGVSTIALRLKLKSCAVTKVVKQAGIMRQRVHGLKLSGKRRAMEQREGIVQ